MIENSQNYFIFELLKFLFGEIFPIQKKKVAKYCGRKIGAFAQ